MRQIYYYRLGSIAARLGCYAVRAGLKLRAAVALPPIFTAEVSGLSKKDCEAALTAFLAATEKALKAGDKVQLVGFGSFEAKGRAARIGRNPATGAEVKIPASKVPAFKPGKTFKDAIQ